MNKIKKFIAPRDILFVHGDKRLKLGNNNGMVIWYRRDLSTVLITPITYEVQWGHVEFTSVPKKRRTRYSKYPGLLMFIGEPYEQNVENIENYFITIGDGWGMRWVKEKTRPTVFLIAYDRPLYCYWPYDKKL